MKIQRITPCLWFDHQAEEAANFYVSLFKNSEVNKITYYDSSGAKASGRPEGSVMTVEFKLDGQDFLALNGGTPPDFATSFTGAISFIINCENQAEIDHFWEKLSEGGKKSFCGWIERDKYGVTWQVTPTILAEYLKDPDKEKVQRVMEAMIKMTKIEIQPLKDAYDQKN